MIVLKLVRCVKFGKTGECKNGNYGLYKGHKNQDFMAKYSPPGTEETIRVSAENRYRRLV